MTNQQLQLHLLELQLLPRSPPRHLIVTTSIKTTTITTTTTTTTIILTTIITVTIFLYLRTLTHLPSHQSRKLNPLMPLSVPTVLASKLLQIHRIPQNPRTSRIHSTHPRHSNHPTHLHHLVQGWISRIS